MAAASDNIDISREISLCSLCNETFRSPKVLTCLHSFCKTCLEDHIGKSLVQNGQRYFPCPTCEAEVDMPSDALPGKYANAFNEDRFMEKLVELINAMKEGKLCDNCERREENVTAGNWCMDCHDALCDSCLKVHTHGKFTSGHVVIAVEDMRKMPLETIMKKNNKVPCMKHNEIITLYCVDCRDPLCVQCMAVSHRRCENVVTVNDAMSSSTDVNDVIVKLQNMQASLENANGLGAMDGILEESIEASRSKIMAICNELCEKVRQEQVKLLKALDSKAELARGTLREKIEPKKMGVKAIRSANERMKMLTRYGSDVEVLLAYNQIRKQFDSCQGDLESIDSRESAVKLDFEVNETMEKFVKEFEKVGEVTLDEGGSTEGLSSWGVTCTSTEDIIVTDCKNKRIQKFSKFGDLVDYVQLEDEPRDITTCGQNDYVAITMVGKLIIYLTTKKTMQLIKRAKTEKQYDGISYSDREALLLVTSLKEQCVDKIQMDGTILRTFQNKPDGLLSFVEPRYISSSPDKSIVVSDVQGNNVLCFTHDGKPLYQYTPNGENTVKRPQGVCFDKLGNLFIADYGNNRVQLLTNEGEFQRHVLGEETGLERPVALRLSSSSRMIIVQGDGMVKVFSYS
ncbi:tripartite motif-containing protein 2-like [Mizuhopecten yessoensis]|uniref:E3 ubiquitin-protein ligase TRIM71 n=1 Tax=Mizuhopecten yessoensis TaxID=6573 RepID=A0A210QEV2_MIZYE|nr:tripartite motif-containing protein 2-like [Mizuhopecten yessoensis]XP_021359907.1 tripartite motif-containing protein 2-like [Mizuhopecten yessoensis]XP_021359909.1 tripartite motif-containing protein 2-like [Mizuhopecten yessoensis]OWF47239.1 E3 ubiquitin-protein ligase TRIM71 [Mizuhopecten yessoensis]